MKFTAKREIINAPGTPTPNCHASTVLPLDNGEVLASWFGGTEEGKSDVVIWVAKKSNDKWGEPVRICAQEDVAHWNPVLFKKKDGTVCLYFKVGVTIKLVWKTFVVYSKDNGETWSEAKELVEGDISGGRGPVKNKSIYISNGDILAPASHEPKPKWFAFVDISKDDGETWEASEYVPNKTDDDSLLNLIQPTLWESEPGKIHMLLRSNLDYIYRSDSNDYGRTWSNAYSTGLYNPNSGIDAVKMDNGTIMLLYNPTQNNWGHRTPLNLSYSTDNGKTWTLLKTLEDVEAGKEEEAEFSYPAITALGNKLYMTYTYNRLSIAYWEITIEE